MREMADEIAKENGVHGEFLIKREKMSEKSSGYVTAHKNSHICLLILSFSLYLANFRPGSIVRKVSEKWGLFDP